MEKMVKEHLRAAKLTPDGEALQALLEDIDAHRRRFESYKSFHMFYYRYRYKQLEYTFEASKSLIDLALNFKDDQLTKDNITKLRKYLEDLIIYNNAVRNIEETFKVHLRNRHLHLTYDDNTINMLQPYAEALGLPEGYHQKTSKEALKRAFEAHNSSVENYHNEIQESSVAIAPSHSVASAPSLELQMRKAFNDMMYEVQQVQNK
eukprot:Pompholyxophrys_punicea_v1_NODE_8_length_8388_cov_12.748020.p3 type:complete len:206 gc:universal NODE_8_length_8388_cov_12.748020:616-1233(+)